MGLENSLKPIKKSNNFSVHIELPHVIVIIYFPQESRDAAAPC